MPTAHSSESGRTYQLDRLIGKGGFGEVYLATPSPQDGLPSQVCVKITERLSGWLREAYFAELLFREPRALRVYDRFVEPDGERTRYCIALEYAMHGDLGVWLERKGAQAERVLARIAPDEERHADLSRSILEWCSSTGGPAVRDAIAHAARTSAPAHTQDHEDAEWLSWNGRLTAVERSSAREQVEERARARLSRVLGI